MEAAEKKLKKSVKVRLKKEALKQFKEENKGKLGAVKSSLRNVPTSPRKMRLVADMIRGQRVNLALNILKFDDKHASLTMEKILLTGIADWQAMNDDVKLEDADLIVKEVYVDGGKMLKRLRPAPQGRAHRIRKRSNHITISIADANENINNTENKD
jgi:large subunit ribosomal protein L22